MSTWASVSRRRGKSKNIKSTCSFFLLSTLVNSVNIIFHCAATVRFDEKLSLVSLRNKLKMR